MADPAKLDNLFLDIAYRIGQMSHSRRRSVGALIVKDGNIISMGWNGMPSGMDNNCEYGDDDALVIREEVLHAESNALMKLAASGTLGSTGATLYCTASPCMQCAKLIAQAKISRVVFRELYTRSDGLGLLNAVGVEVNRSFLPHRNSVNE